MFDPPVDPQWTGWMGYASAVGQAAYAIDIRGYGDSERPPELNDPPEGSDPVLPAEVAARDIRDVIDWIHAEQGFERLHLVGLSSGTWRARALFANHDPDVATVTLDAGSYQQFEASNEDQPAWSTQTEQEFKDRWLSGFPDEADPDEWIGGKNYTAEQVLDAVWKAIYKSGQKIGVRDGEQTILNPTNLLQDEEHDPEAITAPTLVIRGSSDSLISREGALALYDAVGAEDNQKEYTEVAGGTHFSHLKPGGSRSTIRFMRFKPGS